MPLGVIVNVLLLPGSTAAASLTTCGSLAERSGMSIVWLATSLPLCALMVTVPVPMPLTVLNFRSAI
jgi:hypothetical protein